VMIAFCSPITKQSKTTVTGTNSRLGFNRSLQHLCSNTESEGKALWNDRESIG
jgi:hypothetical protein